MARKLNTRNSEEQRRTIQVSVLLKLLHDHAVGTRKLDPGRASSAQFLIRTALPRPPQQIEQTGELVVRWKS